MLDDSEKPNFPEMRWERPLVIGARRAFNIQAIEWQGRDLLQEIDVLTKVITDLVELHEDEPERPVVEFARRVLWTLNHG